MQVSIKICERTIAIELQQARKSLWIATGSIDGTRIETRGRIPGLALSRWRWTASRQDTTSSLADAEAGKTSRISQ